MCQSVWSHLGCPNRSTPLCRSTSWFANSTIALVRKGRSGAGSRCVLVSAGAAGIRIRRSSFAGRRGERPHGRGVDRGAQQSQRPRRGLRCAGDAHGVPGYDEGDDGPVPAARMAAAGRWCRRGSGRGVVKRWGSAGGESHDDGVAFTSGGSWRKLGFDGGYVEHWRADSVSPYGPARMCSPHRRVLGSRLPAAAFDRGRPKERGTVSPRTQLRAARWTTPRRDGSGGSNRSVVADIGRGGTGEALRARRLRRIEGARERRIWAITSQEGYVTTCVGLNPLALRLRSREFVGRIRGLKNKKIKYYNKL